jgi:hypothetical protein
MAAKRPHDDLRRKKHTREPNKRFIIFCEGENTEPHYFKALGRTYNQTIHPIPAGMALPCAEAAIAERKRKRTDSFEKDDQVWAVFDHDDDPHFDQALALCRRHGIGVGWSNPCFEVWLILHIKEFSQCCDSKTAQRYLEKHHPAYDAGREKIPDCALLVQSVEDAEKRAARLLEAHEDEGAPHGRPSTAVHKLTRAIREAARKAKPNPTE